MNTPNRACRLIVALALACGAGAALAEPSLISDEQLAEQLQAQTAQQQQGGGGAAGNCAGITLLGITSGTPGGVFQFPPNSPAAAPLTARYNAVLATMDRAAKENPPLSDCFICIFSRYYLRGQIDGEEKLQAYLMERIAQLQGELRRTQDKDARDTLARELASTDARLQRTRDDLKAHRETQAKEDLQQARFEAAMRPLVAQATAINAEADELYRRLCGSR